MNRRTFLNALLAGVAAILTPKPAKADFFAEMARRGLDDQTVWTPDTYKTILTIPATMTIGNARAIILNNGWLQRT